MTLRPLQAVLGHSQGLRWRSWAALGAYVGDLGPLLGPMLAVLGRSWGLCWRSWAALGLPLAVLGRSWGRSLRSWAALGAYVGGLEPKNAKNIATLKMCLFLERERHLRPWGRS